MRKIFFILVMLLQTIFLYAYVVKGIVVDEKGKPIRKAMIVGYNSMRKVVVGVETDLSGAFTTANVHDSTLVIEVSKEDYATININLLGTSAELIDLGAIVLKPKEVILNEVVVAAQSVIKKTDRYIVIPSKKELEQAVNGISLLNNLQYKMPGLVVNESLQTVLVDNATPVFKINGKPSDLNHFLTLNPQRILRIEYQDNPDVRYENRRVINVILHPRGDGGSVLSNVLGSVNTGFINGNVGVGYYHKKSEWELNYNTSWRDYDKREINSYSQYIGRVAPILRDKKGIPGDFHYLTHVLSLGYTYMHNSTTLFVAKIGMGFEKQKMDEDSWNTQRYQGNLSQYQNLTRKKLNFHSPNVDLFFRKEIDKAQYIEVNVYGRYSSGDYNRRYIGIYTNLLSSDSVLTFTNDKSWRIGGDMMYSKAFKGLIAIIGMQEYYSHTGNEQIENGGLAKSNINQNRLSLYGQIQGKIKQLSYSLSATGVYNHAYNQSYKTDAVRLKSNFVVNYQLSQRFALNYLLMLDPSLPSVSQQSILGQRVDDITFRQGNPGLKPSFYVRNRIYIRYADKLFTASLWASYSRTQNPIYYDYSYINDVASPHYDMFMARPINGQHNDQSNIELNLAAQNLWGVVNLWGSIGWSNSHIAMTDKRFVKNRLYTSLNGALSLGSWLVTAKYQIVPNYNLVGNSYNKEERWNTIKVQYRHKNWQFLLTGVNLFTKRGSFFENIIVSDVHPEEYSQCVRDNANMILLGVSYKFDFGKKHNNVKRSLNNDGIERGIDINY